MGARGGAGGAIHCTRAWWGRPGQAPRKAQNRTWLRTNSINELHVQKTGRGRGRRAGKLSYTLAISRIASGHPPAGKLSPQLPHAATTLGCAGRTGCCAVSHPSPEASQSSGFHTAGWLPRDRW